MPRARLVVLVIAVLSAACGRVSAPPAKPAATPPAAPEVATLGTDPLARSVRRGLALVSATRDSLPAHVGSQLRCVSCHLDEGRRAFAMPWIGTYGRFPQYRSRSGQVARIEDRINDCIQRSLNGRALATDSDEMRDIVTYISWLSRGTTSGQRNFGAGIDSVAPLTPDTARGRVAFTTTCARCHGARGEGMLATQVVNAGPPLWGAGSFNIGSGMARIRVMAAFVHRHMPFDRPGTISPQEAYDVAAFVTAQPRPDFAAKALDWPNGDPPPDVAYATNAKRRTGSP